MKKLFHITSNNNSKSIVNAMSLKFENKFIVFGYIRSNETKMIPNDIFLVCLCYYGHFNDYVLICADDISINYSNPHEIFCITKIRGIQYGSCFGLYVVNSEDIHIYEWIFSLNMINGSQIGLISSQNNCGYIIDDQLGNNTIRYSWSTDGYLFRENQTIRVKQNKAQNGDIIRMELNMSKTNSYLKFYQNGKQFNYIFMNIKRGKDIKYRFGICLFDKNESISLLRFMIDGK